MGGMFMKNKPENLAANGFLNNHIGYGYKKFILDEVTEELMNQFIFDMTNGEKQEKAPSKKPGAPQIIEPTYRDVFVASVDTYGGGKKDLRMNVYLPERSEKPTPALVYIHGGAFMKNDYTQTTNYSDHWKLLQQNIVQNGIALITIGYRLSTEASYPAQIFDVKGAIRFIRAHSKEYNIDPDNIGAVGQSAGGHLVSLLSTTNGVEILEGDVGGNTEYSSHIKYGVGLYGPSDIFTVAQQSFGKTQKDITDSPEIRLIGFHNEGEGPFVLKELKDRNDTNSVNYKKVLLGKLASPLYLATSNTVPMFISHGDFDETVPFAQSYIFYDALKSLGVDVTFYAAYGQNHSANLSPKAAEKEIAWILKQANMKDSI
jgi:acetyl esterase/lipase